MHMNRYTKGTAIMLALTMASGMSVSAADNKFSIEMTEDGWNSIAMANDDTVTSGAVIRSKADEKSNAEGYLYRGGAVEVLSKGDQWTKVRSGKVTGYIKNEYLTYGNEAKGLAEHYGDYGVEADWNDVNVFAADNSAAKIIDTANEGDSYVIANNNGHWIEVETGKDSTAYVSSEDVKKVMLVDEAKSVDDEANASEATDYVETEAEYVETEPAYVETEAAYVETEVQYAETEAEYVETEAEYVETEAQYVETEAQYVETEAVYYDTSTAQGAADAAYQEYLNAQAAADAAAAEGTDAQAINDTAQAAQEAYARYVELQNIADAEAAGVSYEGSDATNGAETYSDETNDETYDETYDDTYEETYVEPEPEYDEFVDESADESYGYDEYTEETEAATPETDVQVSSSDLDLLAAIIWCEAGNQPYDGMVAVGAVVMNRVASGSFPSTISDVIYQSGQFTPSYSGALASALASGVNDTCYAAAQDALNGSDPTGGCLYFNTSHGSGVQIGAHWFY